MAPAAGVGSGQVKLSWTAPSTNGSPITDYLLERSLDGTTWTTVSDGVSTATGSLVGGLTNGTPYSFRVSAVNAVGTGTSSAAAQATPAWTAAAPGALSAAVAPANEVGSGQVTLNWTEPVDTGGSAITGYVIESSTDAVTWTHAGDAASTATTRTVDGLANGTVYSFRVAARNAVGAGVWSAPVQATPVWTPAAPTTVAARVAPATGAGSGQVQLTWIAPADDGGATITDYVIQRSTDGSTWTTVDDGVSLATASTVRGLVNGTQYRFRVAVRNVVGQGPWSAVVQATPRWKPAAPGGLRAAVAPAAGVGSGQVKLAWNAPIPTGGAAVTDYVIQRSTNRSAWTTLRDGVSTARSSLVARLTNGTQYRFRIAARNAVGQGPWTIAVRATPHAR